MSNTIDRASGVAPAVAERVAQARSAYTSKGGEAAASNRGSGDDTLQITGDAMQMQSLEKSLSSGPAFNSERVEALRAAVASGSYKVDPERVADKMLSATPSLS
jgi:negative regulator of flagellin synthesis FlgM